MQSIAIAEKTPIGSTEYPDSLLYQNRYSTGKEAQSENSRSHRIIHPGAPKLPSRPIWTKANKNALTKQIGNNKLTSTKYRDRETSKGIKSKMIRQTIDTESSAIPRIKEKSCSSIRKKPATPKDRPDRNENARIKARILRQEGKNA